MLVDGRVARLLIALGLLSFVGTCALAQDKPDDGKAAVLSAEQVAKNVASFDEVWQTIHDKHFDPNLNGVDWDTVRAELRPEVEKATTMAQARSVMTRMIERLKQSHFAIIPREVYGEVQADNQRKSGQGKSGIDVRIIDGKAVISAVEAGSPAAAAGIKPGWIIAKSDGTDLAPALAKVAETYKDSTQREAREMRAVLSRLGGEVGSKVTLEMLDSKDQAVTREVTLGEPKGVAATFGNLPTFYVRFETKAIEPKLLYVRLNAFFDPVRVISGFGQALREHPDAEGLILDIRGNPGGLGGMAMGLGGWLVEGSDHKLGTMTTRDSKVYFTLNPRDGAFRGPVALLIDGASMSTSEVLAGGLKDMGRARVFGTRSGGAALPSVIVKLPNGDGFQYAFANYVAVGGQVLEGHGVVPDECVAPTREVLLRGEDPVLDAAVKWLVAQDRKAR
jgi:carboxyl-terminal processing protease